MNLSIEKIWMPCLFSILMLPYSSVCQAQDDLSIRWDHGVKLKSNNGEFEFKIGGRLQYDIAFFNQSDEIEELNGKLTSGTEFRRMRLYNAGKLYGAVHYKVQFDFANGTASLNDAYLQFKRIPVIGNLRIGHFKEPLGLESLTSSKYIMFMERSFNGSFVKGRNTGIMVYNEFLNKRIGAQWGIFRNGNKFGNDKMANTDYNFTARLTGLLVNDEIKNNLVHVGFGYSNRSPKNDETTFTYSPAAHLSPTYSTTSVIEEISSLNLYNAELSIVLNSFSFQSEFLRSRTGLVNGETLSFGSYYSQVSYFITGESQNYSNSYSGYGLVTPKNNLGGSDKGIGALEVALRYNSSDLNDDFVSNGPISEWTVGVNWYLNPATRITSNYIIADVEEKGTSHIWQMRFQVAF